MAEAAHVTVLVVDDALDTLGMLCAALQGAGHQVLVAASGQAALQALSLSTPDAVLLDAVMPGLSGFDTCRAIKADPGLAPIPVIFMTGLTETEHVLEGFAAGGVDYVTKPLRTDEVLARLQTHVRNARWTWLAREAMDVAGRGVVLLDASCQRIVWCSPRAREWLGALGLATEAGWPAHWAPGEDGERVLGEGAARLRLRRVGQRGGVGLGETLLLLEPAGVPAPPAAARLAALTAREAEVLSWLAKGKTNRDIAEILGISRHTVSKHLEHLFEKLGVETRAAASALAARMGAV